MAKKITDTTPLSSFDDAWGGTYTSGPNAGKEWGKEHGEVERVIKEKVAAMETNIGGKVAGVIVNNSEVAKDANGKVTAVGVGTAQITASHSGTSASCNITVEKYTCWTAMRKAENGMKNDAGHYSKLKTVSIFPKSV